jgi:F-type H+-transporting ATPase subunit gamma
MAGQEGIEEIKTRLSNIRSVEPILGAMRTISLGSWQAALKRKGLVLEYTQRLLALLPWLAPMLDVRRRRRQDPKESLPPSISVVAIGTQRGLCGAFNSSLIRYAQAELERLQTHGARNAQVELCALGARITRMLEYQGHAVARSWPLPMSALPTNGLANELTHAWLGRYEARELDAVYLIYNTYRNSTLYEPVTVRLIPPPIPSSPEASEPWSKPYVDTDPMSLYTRLVVLWATTEVYRILLDSAAAEHSARYQLMEGAAQNSSRLIDELTLALQSARQHAITSEMQELAAGAGLLGSQEA